MEDTVDLKKRITGILYTILKVTYGGQQYATAAHRVIVSAWSIILFYFAHGWLNFDESKNVLIAGCHSN